MNIVIDTNEFRFPLSDTIKLFQSIRKIIVNHLEGNIFIRCLFKMHYEREFPVNCISNKITLFKIFKSDIQRIE